MVVHPDQFERELETTLDVVAKQRGVRFATNLRPILLANLERGRIEFYLNGHAQAQLYDYVWRVADYYDRLSPYLRKIQKTKSQDVWEPLLADLRKWARGILQRTLGLSIDPNQLALEYASMAAEKILTAYFPYDTEFAPWAYVLVRNVCSQQLKRDNKGFGSIDDDLIAQLPDLWHDYRVHLRELRQELLAAVMQLSSDARKQLIVLHYFQGHSLPEVAARLNKTLAATYKLHFDTLAELRKIWASKEHKDE